MSVSTASNSNIYKIISDAAGLVGIGTSSPGYKLDVAGDIRLSNNNALFSSDSGGTGRRMAVLAASGHIYLGDVDNAITGGFLYVNAKSSISLRTNNTERMLIDSSGNVGIGITTSAGNLLDVNGNITIRDAYYLNFGNAGSGDVSIRPTGTGGARGMSFYTYNGAPARHMDIDVNGNVGIGTSSPAYALDVSGDIRVSTGLYWTATDKKLYVPLDGCLEWFTHNSASDHSFAVSHQGTKKVVLNTNGDSYFIGGNVGIGTTSPVAELHVKPSGYGGIYIERRSDLVTDSGALWFDTSTSGNPYIKAVAGDLVIHTGATINVGGGTERLRLTAAGNVGIGTSSPGYSLDVVAGANLAARFCGAAGNHTVVNLDSASDSYAPYLLFRRNGVDKWLLQAWTDNNFYVLDKDQNNGVYIAQDTTSWVANSDARLKDVIGPIENATAKVNALSGVRYTWKRDADKSLAKVRVGLIAQDVFEVLPESVEADNPDIITDEETGKVSGGLGVRYTELVPLLVNAIKELTTRIATLEQRA